jgi:hypothetical protein
LDDQKGGGSRSHPVGTVSGRNIFIGRNQRVSHSRFLAERCRGTIVSCR